MILCSADVFRSKFQNSLYRFTLYYGHDRKSSLGENNFQLLLFVLLLLLYCHRTVAKGNRAQFHSDGGTFLRSECTQCLGE